MKNLKAHLVTLTVPAGMALAAVMCVALMGCEDSGISSTDVDLTDPPLTVTKNEPEILVNEFLSKAEIFVERVYGFPWSELSKMDVSELPEIEGEKSSEQVEESWKELQVVMKELASYNGTMTNIKDLELCLMQCQIPEGGVS